jgi:acyl-CoA synthetase (AMP-forming)/AMP-acid ligase II
VHLLEALAGKKLALPTGSRVMETGGFKGHSRELPRKELHAALAGSLGLAPERIVNQYGMTELGSQFYDSVLVDRDGARRKLGPPWVRVRLIDPESGAEAQQGKPGMIQVHDLANTGSVASIQTADLGRSIDGSPPGFEVLGRLAGAEERGCSIAADAMLGGST